MHQRRRRYQPLHGNYIQPEAPIHLWLRWADGEVDPKLSGDEPLTLRERYELRRAARRTVEEAARDVDVSQRTARSWEHEADVARPGPPAERQAEFDHGLVVVPSA